MKIFLVGATGNIGSRILREAVSRGHEVTAAVRREGALDSAPQVQVVQADATDPGQIAGLAAGHDVVVVSVSARKPGDTPIPEVVGAIAQAVRKSGVSRLFAVGGAGSLEVAPGVQLLDTPQFPEAYKPEALQGRESLNLLRTSDINWVYLSPAIIIAPGERTGKYRTGGNQLLSDADGKSFISIEDYAVAVLDELENPKHIGQRFSVAY